MLVSFFIFFDRQTRMCMCLLYCGVFLCLCPVESWFFKDLSNTAMDKTVVATELRILFT